MIILGKNKDDTGTQLEKLVEAILKKLGYVDVVTNKVGSGGQELDVTGAFPVPIPGGGTAKRLIAECKAYKKVVDVPTWLKFLGRIFTDEHKTGEKVSGCLIALSGVNGNCQGAYDDLKSIRKDITIIAGETLQRHLEDLFSMKKAGDIERLVRQLTDRAIRIQDVAYYDKAVYWAIGFQDDTFALLDATGRPIPRETVDKLVKLIKKSEALGQYIDIEAEAGAKKMAIAARKFVLSLIIDGAGATTIQVMTSPETMLRLGGFHPDALKVAIEQLKGVGIVQQDQEKITVRDPSTCGYGHLPAFFRELLGGFLCSAHSLGKPYYDQLISGGLFEEIVKIQRGVKFTDEQKKKAIELLTLTPSGLWNAVNPIAVIVNHRSGETNDPPMTDFIDKGDVDYFFQMLHECLNRDFRTDLFHEYFHETRKMVELDTSYQVKLKSDTALVFQDEVRVRSRLGELDIQFTPGRRRFILMQAMNGSPEPWDMNTMGQQAATEGKPVEGEDQQTPT
jgi:hypothetical protein